MAFLSDAQLQSLRDVLAEPDLSETKYRLTGPLGSGGMGSVWEAEDPELLRTVAIKVLDLPDDAGELAQRLVQEARVLARLEHPGLVPVHDLGTLPDGRPFYAMKVVRGTSLDEGVTSLGWIPDRLRLFLRICEPVAFAHAHGVLHRDLKPQNVMVGPFGEVLVMDWGLAKVIGTLESRSIPDTSKRRPGLTGAGTVMGTPGFMAPEQERGDLDSLDARTDVYSLGVILDFLLTEPGEETKVDRRVKAISKRARAAAPGDRYPDVLALMQDIARYLDGEPVSAYRERAWERIWRLMKRHQVALVLLLAYLLARAAVFLVYRR